MPQRILLINPPTGLYRRDNRCQNAIGDQTVKVVLSPNTLAYIAALHEQAGDICRIEDYPAEDKDFDDLKKDLEDFKPDRLYIGITTATISLDMESARLAHELNPNLIAIAFGYYFNTYGQEIMASYPMLDIAIYSEVEGVVLDLLQKRDIKEVKGIFYRDKGTIVRNEEHPGLSNPDIIPYPARHLLKNELYLAPDTGNKLGVITTSRGCAFHCIFCPAGRLTNHKIFHRSAGNIYGEIKDCTQKYGIREFLFNADTFTAKKGIVIELCNLIKDGNLKIVFAVNSRVDTVDEELLVALKSAGCKMVAFGVESGNQTLLDKMKKGIKLEQTRRAISICKRLGILCHTFYIIGLPWETKETLKETFRFMKELDADFFDINIAYPLPGTELFDIAKRDGLFEEQGLDQHSYATSPIRSYELTTQELLNFRRKALRSLYLRPKYILRTILRVITKPNELFRYIAFGLKRLKQIV